MAEVDADLPGPRVRQETEIIAQSGAKERVFAQLLTVFGGCALLIASIGLFGITSYAVTRRTSEIGVRLALGATPGQVLWMVLRQVVVLGGIGPGVGVPAAIAGAPLVGRLLFGVAPTRPPATPTAPIALMGGAVGAGHLPPLRAARPDPPEAVLRE